MRKIIFLSLTVIFFTAMPLCADEVDYKEPVRSLLDAPFRAYGVNYQIKEVVATETPDWKAVIISLPIKNGRQPEAVFVSADGKTVIFENMIYVNGVPVLTKLMVPEIDKVAIALTSKSRKVFNPKGGKGLFMFFDPECAYCLRVEEKLKSYKGEYRVILKNYPLVDIHPNAMAMAIDRQETWLRESHEPGMDDSALKSEAERIVKQDMAEGAEAGVTGTPFFVADDGTVVQPVF